MAIRFWLLCGVLLVAVGAGGAPARAQTDGSQVRYIAELKQRNTDAGAGCDGIGVTVPQTVDMPADISERWVAGHSACVPGMRLVMACLGDVRGEDRLIGCTLQVADGEAAGDLTCEQFSLIAPDARFTPDPVLSEDVGEGSGAAAEPCSESGVFAAGRTVAAAFLVPADQSRGDLAVLVDVDGSEVPAFLIPAGQLGLPEATPVP